jgi:hypothetical protein
MIRTLFIMAAFFSIITRMFGGSEKPEYEVADVYTGMREMVLNLNDDQIAELRGKPVLAVLMETGHDRAAVTVVAIADGTASLYFSNGGGMIGLGEHANVRPASLAFVASSKKFIKKMTKTDSFPLPKKGETIFYVVTPEGTYTYKGKEDDLGKKRDELYPFFYDGHELITQMRIADEKRRAEPAAGGDAAR